MSLSDGDARSYTPRVVWPHPKSHIVAAHLEQIVVILVDDVVVLRNLRLFHTRDLEQSVA